MFTNCQTNRANKSLLVSFFIVVVVVVFFVVAIVVILVIADIVSNRYHSILYTSNGFVLQSGRHQSANRQQKGEGGGAECISKALSD